MTWFFSDRRSDFAAAFPEICVRAIPAGVHNGEVTFELTRPEQTEKSMHSKWFEDRLAKSLLGAKSP